MTEQTQSWPDDEVAADEGRQEPAPDREGDEEQREPGSDEPTQ